MTLTPDHRTALSFILYTNPVWTFISSCVHDLLLASHYSFYKWNSTLPSLYTNPARV